MPVTFCLETGTAIGHVPAVMVRVCGSDRGMLPAATLAWAVRETHTPIGLDFRTIMPTLIG